jgi:hypothetical protein
VTQPSTMTRFAEASFGPIDVDGLTVHPMLRLKASPGDTFEAVWISAHSPRVQGLSFRLRDPLIAGAKGRAGMLRYGKVDSPGVGLWMDAESMGPIEVLRTKAGAELQVSNRWRMPDGRVDEWFQNYGMLIEELTRDTYLLRCSDGIHMDGPEFDDLVVRVSVRRATT